MRKICLAAMALMLVASCVILEYDALRGTKGAFHGDQHSAQGL